MPTIFRIATRCGATLTLLMVLNQVNVIAQFQLDSADQSPYYAENYLRYDNHCYRANVVTVNLYPTGWPLGPPIIALDQDKALELHFDILDSTLGNFMYSLIHCDYDWQPSELDLQEYLDGPPEDFINEYEYSRNTYQKYVHYTLQLPNDVMRLTKSGNYLLRVYEDGDPDNLILTRRFCVYESLLGVQGNVHQATRVKERYSHQEIDFTISTQNYPLTNPYSDLKVVILQNHTWENAVTGLTPRFVKDNLLDYNYDGENTFDGINEFRMIDLKNTRFTGQGVDRITYTDRENHAYLIRDKSRASMAYLQRPDLNGWYFIKNDWLNTENNIDADYVHVHFRLASPQMVSGGDVYVFGALTDWQIKPEAKMRYNADLQQYECTMYLKQGLYNFLYAFVTDGQTKPEFWRFEGSHFQTENEYTVLVYHRPLGLDYDRLIGVTEFRFGND